jgi:uncharacterized membrane protein YagU involved in acid resistance
VEPVLNPNRIVNGILASLAGGVAFGLIMTVSGKIKMVAMLVGSDSAAVGWVVHLAISALFGALFGVLFGTFGRPLAAGLIYGVIWTFLGPLTLMPLFMGMGLMWSAEAIRGSGGDLLAHLIWGGILGYTYGWLEGRRTLAKAGEEQKAAP